MPTVSSELQDSRVTRIVGQDESYAADVIPQLGKNALVNTQLILDDTIINGVISVTTNATALKVSTTKMANRKTLLIQPTNGTIYIGASDVTTANGIIVMKNQIVIITSDVEVYGIASSSINTRIIEGK